MSAPKFIIGFDPATGSSSKFGLALFEVEQDNKGFNVFPSLKLLKAVELTAWGKKSVRDRIKAICAQVVSEVKKIEQIQDATCALYIESFVMRGKGGETLQRLIGAVMTVTPSTFEFYEVSNMQVKAFVSGHGHGDKLAVAKGVLEKLENDEQVAELIRHSAFDALDACAIALTGFEQTYGKVGLTSNPGKGTHNYELIKTKKPRKTAKSSSKTSQN